MPNFINAGGDSAADFAASLVAAAEGDTEDAAEPAVVESDPVELEGSDDAEEGTASDSDDADDAGDDDGSPEDDEDDGSVPDLSAVGQLFVDGDLAGACKALGIDPKILKVSEPKFKAMREGLREARQLKTEAETIKKAGDAALTQAQQIIAAGKKEYGHLVDLKNSLALGDYSAAKDILEELAPKGTTYQQIAEGIVLAAKGASPAEAAYKRRLRELEKEKAEREAAEAAERTKAEEAAAARAMAEKNLRGAEARLKGTDFDGVEGAAAKLVEIVSQNWDYERKGLKIKPEKCLELLGQDPVISKLVKLKKLEAGKLRTTPPRATDGKFVAPARVKGKIGQRTPPAAKPPRQPTIEDERRAAIQEASRLEAAEQRRLRGGRR